PSGTIEDRFNLPPGLGTALEIFGESTSNLLGYGFIYTNRDTLSVGTGALLEDLIRTGVNVNDMLDRFKRHPSIAPLLAGGETVEYSAHLIPEGGYNRMPQVYADGVVVVGDAAGFVNPLNREGVNLAMLSGQMAARAIVEATGRGDFSAATLSRYRELLEDSVVIKDLYKIRNVTDFAHARPHLLADYPDLISEMARAYLTVDGKPKAEKYRSLAAMAGRMPKRRLAGDLWGAIKTLR
ncbi:MAG: tryptophan 7-halogenase, partial [Chloroflexia bacterium]|nr:tryptophan 7-halogenase [Chloroflexia bacterium]